MPRLELGIEANGVNSLLDPSIRFSPDWGDARSRRRIRPLPPELIEDPVLETASPESEPAPAVADPAPASTPLIADRATGPAPALAPAALVAPDRSARPSGLSGLSLALVVAGSIFAGGLAVAVLDRMVARPVLSSPSAADSARNSEVATLVSLVERQRSELEAIRETLTRIEDRPKEKDPSPALFTQIAELRSKVETLESDSRALRTVPELVAGVKNDLSRGVDTLRADLTSLREREQHDAQKPANYPAIDASTVLVDRAKALFLDKKYSAAREIFLGLTESAPSDARAWYYAGLCTSFVTQEWGGEASASLFRKGVECERNGTPDRAAIDAALAPLDRATGKDWVSFYRESGGVLAPAK